VRRVLRPKSLPDVVMRARRASHEKGNDAFTCVGRPLRIPFKVLRRFGLKGITIATV